MCSLATATTGNELRNAPKALVLRGTRAQLTAIFPCLHVMARTEGRNGMSSMIVFTCPETGHDVSSGVLTDEHTFSNLPRHEMVVRCKECGGEHRWWVADGKLGKVKDARLPVPVRIP
jgi:hypothetical protein